MTPPFGGLERDPTSELGTRDVWLLLVVCNLLLSLFTILFYLNVYSGTSTIIFNNEFLCVIPDPPYSGPWSLRFGSSCPFRCWSAWSSWSPYLHAPSNCYLAQLRVYRISGTSPFNFLCYLPDSVPCVHLNCNLQYYPFHFPLRYLYWLLLLGVCWLWFSSLHPSSFP